MILRGMCVRRFELCCARLSATVLLTVAALLAGCASSPDPGPARDPLGKVTRLLAIDFSPQAATRRVGSFRRLLGVPLEETRRVPALVSTAVAAPARAVRRADALPAALGRAVAGGLARGVAFTRPSPVLLEALPSPERFAATTARDLERLGFLLGLERRPLPEFDDRRHRTDPYDDRPEKTLWQRLSRRVFP